MKRINFLFIPLVVVLFIVFSCKEEVIEPILDLSQKEIKLDKTGSVITIDVATNQDNWIATSPAEGDWLYLEQHESTLSVKATENEFGKTRSTYILVQAGMLFQKIALSQLEADVVLEVSPNEINFANSGGIYRIDIRTNTEIWELEKEVESIEWLQIKTFTDFAEIVAAPNTDKNVRAAKLLAKSGSVIREITVNQVGIGNTRFILPYFNPLPTHYELLDFERSRGHHLVYFNKPKKYFNGRYVFVYSSPIFDRFVQYNISWETNSIDEISMISSNGAEALLSQDYKDFLEENGFRNINVDQDTKSLTAEAKFESVFVKLKLTTKGDIAYLNFSFVVPQD